MARRKGGWTGNEKFHTDDWRRRAHAARERQKDAMDKLRPRVDRERLPRPYKPDPRSQRPRPMRPSDYNDGPVIDNDTGKRVPPPRDPNAQRGKGGLSPRVKFPKLPRNPLPLARIPDLLDDIDKYNPYGKLPDAEPNPAWGWVRKGLCPAFTPGMLDGGRGTGPLSPTQSENHSWHNSANTCLGLQAGGEKGWPYPFNNNRTVLLGLDWNSAGTRNTLRKSWWRPVSTTGPGPKWVTSWGVSPDPNRLRAMPGMPPNWYPDGSPKGPGYDDGGSWAPSPSDPAPLPPGYPGGPMGEPTSSEAVEVSTGTGSGGVFPTTPTTRTPPEAGERQHKAITKSAKIGQMLFRAMDAISEGAEIVDAVYDALPEDVRKRWEKERFPDARWIKDKRTGRWVRVGVERQGDNYGQYGIDGADWKLKALYYNWHKVDVEKAVRNIIKNGIEDQVIGRYKAALPKQTGAAHSEGDIAFAKWLDSLLDGVI